MEIVLTKSSFGSNIMKDSLFSLLDTCVGQSIIVQRSENTYNITESNSTTKHDMMSHHFPRLTTDCTVQAKMS